MTDQFFTVEQIAKMLNIHPKTIQRYIREGKLHATKLGRSWRVTGHDLSRFTEASPPPPHPDPIHAAGPLSGKASAVIDLQVPGQLQADRVITALTAAMKGKPAEYGDASLAAQYIPAEDLVRLTLWGNIPFMATIFASVELFLTQWEEEDHGWSIRF